MKSEQRGSIRKPISVDVLVNYAFVDPRLWCTRDLGMHSAFVKMPRPDLPLGAMVDLVLYLHFSEDHEPHVVSARIVRSTKEGIAVMFDTYGQRTLAALATLLDGAQQHSMGRAASTRQMSAAVHKQ